MMFRGVYGFMSNFYSCDITVDGLTFSCVEAAFQACKTLDPDIRRQFVGLDGSAAKRLGRRIPLRPGWEKVKVEVMRQLLRQKFADPQLAMKLISVEEEIVEDNTWGDTFWGRCNGRGLNMLGRLLQEVRHSLMVR